MVKVLRTKINRRASRLRPKREATPTQGMPNCSAKKAQRSTAVPAATLCAQASHPKVRVGMIETSLFNDGSAHVEKKQRASSCGREAVAPAGSKGKAFPVTFGKYSSPGPGVAQRQRSISKAGVPHRGRNSDFAICPMS